MTAEIKRRQRSAAQIDSVQESRGKKKVKAGNPRQVKKEELKALTYDNQRYLDYALDVSGATLEARQTS